MNKLIRSAMAAMMLFIGTQGFSQTKTPPAPVKVTSVEGITEYKLANGLRVLLFPDPSNQPSQSTSLILLVHVWKVMAKQVWHIC